MCSEQSRVDTSIDPRQDCQATVEDLNVYELETDNLPLHTSNWLLMSQTFYLKPTQDLWLNLLTPRFMGILSIELLFFGFSLFTLNVEKAV